MPDDEGLALHAAGRRAEPPPARCSRSAPTAESRRSISARPPGRPARCCSPSTTTAAARRTRPAGSTTTRPSSIRAPAAWTRCPFFRRTIEDAGLEDVVIAVIGDSPTVARYWGTPAGSAVHRRGPRRATSPMADYAAWAPLVCRRRPAGHPRRVRGPGRRRPGAVPRVAAGPGRRVRLTTTGVRACARCRRPCAGARRRPLQAAGSLRTGRSSPRKSPAPSVDEGMRRRGHRRRG